jgi:thiol:disulfide interchange protein DsbC
MSALRRFPRHALLAPALSLALPAVAFAQCPTAEQVSKTIQDVFKRPGIEVLKVSPAPLKGLCEVQVGLQGKPNVLYTDAAGAYFVTGHMIDTKSGKDITEETLTALNTIPPEELKKIDALVAMTVGTKGPAVYFVTDPM